MINVFVVDHAAGSSRGIRKLLAETDIPGFNVNYTTCYRDILEAFRGSVYDVCVIDSASGNGPRLIAQARSFGFSTPIILVTSDDAQEAVKAIRSGVADCLVRDDLTPAGIERLICSVVEQARETTQQNDRARRYLALLDNADEIIFTHDLKGNCTSVNSAGEQRLGYSQEEWQTLSMIRIVDGANRDVAQLMIQQTLDARCQTLGEIELLTREGQSLRVEAVLHPVYQMGRAVEVQWIARDLTTAKRFAPAFFRNTQHQATRGGIQRFSA